MNAEEIVEILRNFNEEFQEDVIADFYIEEIAARIGAKSEEGAEERYKKAKSAYKKMDGRHIIWLYDDEILEFLRLAAFGKEDDLS